MSSAASTKPVAFGVAGLGVMGANLAQNIEDHGFPVTVWNLEPEKTDEFTQKHGTGHAFVPTKSLPEFIKAMPRPRKILLMITAGNPVDQMLASLSPLLEEGDIVIDGGNSWFKDTQRREAELKKKNFNFFGMGVSGGEEGARFGPSMMPGGAKSAYEQVKNVLEAIAAKTESGACVTYVGPDGAGHFVKMVHNGIEYGDMQLIAEAYDLLRKGLGLSAAELADIFAEWNRGTLESFLIEITAKIFTVADPSSTGKPLVDQILDKAGQKGTGKWTEQISLDLAVAIPTIAAAIDARVLSSMKDERVAASQALHGPQNARYSGDKKEFIKAVHDALYASKVCSYAQGMSLIQHGSKEYNWNINMREMARIWKGGCIIRARFLDTIMQAYEQQPDLKNLLLFGPFRDAIANANAAWRKVIMSAFELGIPAPAMSASLCYYDSYRSPQLPQNLTQAQRDFFGAHTYQRVDNPNGPFVHTDWLHLLPKK